MSEDKDFIDWWTFERTISHIANEVRDKDLDRILVPARGGMPGGVMLSHMLDLPLDTIRATHYDGTEQQEKVVLGVTPGYSGREQILLYDDVVDTGETLQAIKERCGHQENFTTAASFVKPGRKFDVDYWFMKKEQWIVFPWEVSL